MDCASSPGPQHSLNGGRDRDALRFFIRLQKVSAAKVGGKASCASLKKLMDCQIRSSEAVVQARA